MTLVDETPTLKKLLNVAAVCVAAGSVIRGPHSTFDESKPPNPANAEAAKVVTLML